MEKTQGFPLASDQGKRPSKCTKDACKPWLDELSSPQAAGRDMLDAILGRKLSLVISA